MTILILFHTSFRDLKHFYLFVQTRMKIDFPHTIMSYNRFVELQRTFAFLLLSLSKWRHCSNTPVFLLSTLLLSATATSKEKSSTKHSRNLPREREMHPRMVLWIQPSSDYQWQGKTSSTFFSLRAMRTTERCWNIWTSTNESLASSSKAGDISRKISSNSSLLTESTLRTRLKREMKNALMLQHDKIMLQKKSLIETVNDQLKDICRIELNPPSMLSEVHHQSVISFCCFLLWQRSSINTAEEVVHPSFLPTAWLGRPKQST